MTVRAGPQLDRESEPERHGTQLIVEDQLFVNLSSTFPWFHARAGARAAEASPAPSASPLQIHTTVRLRKGNNVSRVPSCTPIKPCLGTGVLQR
jgi:hypothetical protein